MQLKIIKADTWNLFAAAYRNLETPKNTLSNLANRYDKIRFKFSTAVVISGINEFF